MSGNLLQYYEEANPSAVVAPDVFVVMGMSNHRSIGVVATTRAVRHPPASMTSVVEAQPVNSEARPTRPECPVMRPSMAGNRLTTPSGTALGCWRCATSRRSA